MSATHSWLGAAGEVRLDPIRGGRGGDRAAAVLAAPAAVHALDAAGAHQPGGPLAVPGVPAVADLGGQPPGAIDPAVFDPGGAGGLDGVGVGEFGGGRAAGADGPGVEAGGAELEHPAETAHAVAGLLRGGELAD